MTQWRDPAWLRSRAAHIRCCLAGHGREVAPASVRIRVFQEPGWAEREAQRCEERAAAIERGEPVPDMEVAVDGADG